MSLLMAATILSFTLQRDAAPASTTAPVAGMTDQAMAAGLAPAREWLALVDRQAWDESWRTSAQKVSDPDITAARWISQIRSLRQRLGAVSSRKFMSATVTNSPLFFPDGEYEAIRFDTDFAGKHDAVEDVMLKHEPSGWKVIGYQIEE